LQGAVASLAGVTGMIGPLVFTQIFAFGIASSWLHLPGAPYLLSATLLGSSLLVALVVTAESGG
jgi:DHA1 family tetracycline resistance protein-like MFS transporter